MSDSFCKNLLQEESPGNKALHEGIGEGNWRSNSCVKLMKIKGSPLGWTSLLSCVNGRSQISVIIYDHGNIRGRLVRPSKTGDIHCRGMTLLER